MPIDANIAMGYNPGTPLNSPLNVMAQMQAVQNARQENAMRQAQMANYESEVARRNALLPAELAKADREAKAAELTQGSANAKLIGERLDLRRRLLETVQTPEQYLAWHEGNHKDPIVANWLTELGVDPEKSRADILADLQKPGGFETLLRNSALGMDKAMESHFQTQDYGGGERLIRTPKYGTGEATVVSGSDIKKTQAPGAAAQLEETQRHNRETERTAADRLALDREKMGAGGEIDAKERNKREAAYPKVSGAYRAATHEIDSLITDITALQNHPGVSGITGLVAGRTPNLTGPARQAQAILDRVLAKGQFRGLQAMREASPTGGALGNISDKEGAALRAAFGALNQTQDTEDFKTALENVLSDLRFSKGNIDQTYADTYAYKGGNAAPAASGAAPATPAAKGPRKTASGVSYTVED